MTTGPQHYAEAERLLAQAFAQPDQDSGFALPAAPKGPDPVLIAAAQAHATLALAAATALQQDSYSASVLAADDYDAWWRAASEGPATQAARRQRDRDELAGFQAEYRSAGRSMRATSTADWFAKAVAAGCTATGYGITSDTLNHTGAPACPVHEPGDVVPAELREDRS